jgi:hypothetical protein
MKLQVSVRGCLDVSYLILINTALAVISEISRKTCSSIYTLEVRQKNDRDMQQQVMVKADNNIARPAIGELPSKDDAWESYGGSEFEVSYNQFHLGTK